MLTTIDQNGRVLIREKKSRRLKTMTDRLRNNEKLRQLLDSRPVIYTSCRATGYLNYSYVGLYLKNEDDSFKSIAGLAKHIIKDRYGYDIVNGHIHVTDNVFNMGFSFVAEVYQALYNELIQTDRHEFI